MSCKKLKKMEFSSVLMGIPQTYDPQTYDPQGYDSLGLRLVGLMSGVKKSPPNAYLISVGGLWSTR